MRISAGQWVLGTSLQANWVEPSSKQKAFWAPDFFLKNKKSALLVDSLQILTTREIRDLWRSIFTDSSSGAPSWDLKWQRAEKSDLVDQIQQLKFLFQTKILKKAVPIVIDRAHLDHGDLKADLEKHALYFLNALTELPETLMPYGFVGEDWMLGATPEVLVKKQNGLVKTHALAGTTLDLNYDLLNDPKERFEHQLVIDEIQNLLSDEGQVVIGETSEKKLPRLKHLQTPIELRGSTASLFELARKLHPTPALGGFPKKSAWDWLERQKSAALRERFGAPFGYWDENGDGLLVVGIRNIQVIKDQLLLSAGCGVVEQSDPDREWLEVSGKKESVRAIWESL